MAELELRDLQLGALAIDDGPILAPIELKGFTQRKDQRHKGSSRGISGALLLLLSPASCECRNSIIRPGETQGAQVCVDLLKRSALLARPACFRLQPTCELRGEPVELAGTLTLRIVRHHGARPDIAPDCVSGYAQSFCDLAQRDMIAKVPAPNDAQYCHVDHSVLPLVA
ncbi:hypothetical protein SBC2_85910 (plasmid) [Caballeronia sp. SBC2]|nr:hypothetical protein SBC2_85910 [Caballeronia sp. SBC2]